VSGALAAAQSFLIEPADAPPPPAPRDAPQARAVIAVFGLARGCGTTVVARGLAAELARRDPAATAAVACEGRTAGIPLATQAATLLAQTLNSAIAGEARALGRLCLVQPADHTRLSEAVRPLAPLVIDAGASLLGGVPAVIADAVVLVSSPAVEPALAPVARECLARVGPEPLVALNRVDWPGAGSAGSTAHAEIELPSSRMGAQLALGGREARGDLGRAIAALADRCGGMS
jgi:hypothetical protein